MPVKTGNAEQRAKNKSFGRGKRQSKVEPCIRWMLRKGTLGESWADILHENNNRTEDASFCSGIK